MGVLWVGVPLAGGHPVERSSSVDGLENCCLVFSLPWLLNPRGRTTPLAKPWRESGVGWETRKISEN